MKTVFYYLGSLLQLQSLFLILPLIVAFIYSEPIMLILVAMISSYIIGTLFKKFSERGPLNLLQGIKLWLKQQTKKLKCIKYLLKLLGFHAVENRHQYLSHQLLHHLTLNPLFFVALTKLQYNKSRLHKEKLRYQKLSLLIREFCVSLSSHHTNTMHLLVCYNIFGGNIVAK